MTVDSLPTKTNKKTLIQNYLSFQEKHRNDFIGKVKDLNIWYLSPLLLWNNSKGEVFSYSIWPYFVGAQLPISDYVLVWSGFEGKIREVFIETNKLQKIMGKELFTEDIAYVEVKNILRNNILRNAIYDSAHLVLDREAVGTEELFLPGKTKYFISFKFRKKNERGVSKLAFFRNNDDLQKLTNIVGYASKVEPGNIVTDTIEKEIKEIFGRSSEYRIKEINKGGTANDRYGNEIRRYSLEVLLPDITPKHIISGLIPEWISAEQYEGGLI